MIEKPFSIPLIFIKRMKWGLIAFLTSYVTIYRFSNCLFNRYNLQSIQPHTLSSIFSGITYYVYPDQAILSHVAINVIEIFWKLNYERIKLLIPFIPFDKLSMTQIVFPIVFGYLCHVRAFTPWLAPSMLKKLMHLTTNFK